MATNFTSLFLRTPLGDGGGGGMYYGTTPLIFQRASELRNAMTPAEESLWKSLYINEWKLKFRRQHPIANYIVDFYCHSLKLVIEIDGDVHNQEDVKRNDIERENFLKSLGLTVLRYTNEEIYKNRSKLLQRISETINRLSNSPSGDRGKLYIIKIGGNVIDDEMKLLQFLQTFANAFSPLQGMGAAILVHGGGKLATQLAIQLGIEQQLVEGRRITDAETLKIVTMVYAGFINKNIVAQLQAQSCAAIGLCGADGNLMQAHKRVHPSVDYGFVGDIDNINTSFLQNLLSQNLNIVIAPITHDKHGQLLNTNADTIAQEIAQAMSAFYEVHLIYSFEKNGVLLDVNNESSVIPTLTYHHYQQLKAPLQGMGALPVIFAGMIPKLDNAFAALNKGVHRVVIGKAEQLEQLISGESGTSIIYE